MSDINSTSPDAYNDAISTDNTNTRLAAIFITPVVCGGVVGFSAAKYFKSNTKKGVAAGILLGVSVDCLLMGSVIYALNNLT